MALDSVFLSHSLSTLSKRESPALNNTADMLISHIQTQFT